MGVSLPNVLLLLINAVFVAAGALLVSFALKLKATGWTDALDGTEYESTAQLAITVTKALGFVAIALAVIGVAGAVTRNRVLLLLYSFCMALMMLVFGVIGAAAFAFKGKLGDWQAAAFPANKEESSLAGSFNEAYCYAQGAYLCNNATTHEAVKVFLPELPESAAALLPDVQGINSLCEKKTALMAGLQSVCTACAQAKQFAKYDKILTWANDKCPRTATTSTWCGKFLATGKGGEVFVSSPYSQCRTIFLGIAADWANSLAVMGVLAALAAAFLVALSCSSRRAKHAGSNSGSLKA
ncbi:hypothetical protein PybrP1_003410 [[Pythium] brassicae (nom. inval.)]|nr:hypothetical protein PybrP1_003410 [[Pythium] brassicae (nom. inval.)]